MRQGQAQITRFEPDPGIDGNQVAVLQGTLYFQDLVRILDRIFFHGGDQRFRVSMEVRVVVPEIYADVFAICLANVSRGNERQELHCRFFIGLSANYGFTSYYDDSCSRDPSTRHDGNLWSKPVAVVVIPVRRTGSRIAKENMNNRSKRYSQDSPEATRVSNSTAPYHLLIDWATEAIILAQLACSCQLGKDPGVFQSEVHAPAPMGEWI